MLGQVVSAAGDSCEGCPAGKHASTIQSACQECAPGSAASIPGTASCTICPAGNDQTLCGQRAATAIPIRFPGAKDTCGSCEADEASPKGSSRCYSCKPGFEFGDDGYTCKACSPGYERPHTQMSCSRVHSGSVAPKSSKRCSPATKAHTLQMRHRAHPAPKATTALEVPLYPQNASTYRRIALLARPRLKSPKQARTQTASAQQRSRAKKAFTALVDVASSVHQDRTALLE